MDLADVVYIIDGSLELEELPEPTPDGHRFRATLFDTIHDPCMLQGRGLRPEPGSQWSYATASATGPLRTDALRNLVERIAGNSLGHDWPCMWKSVTDWVRIPPTLTVGKILPILNKERPFHAPEASPAA